MYFTIQYNLLNKTYFCLSQPCFHSSRIAYVIYYVTDYWGLQHYFD